MLLLFIFKPYFWMNGGQSFHKNVVFPGFGAFFSITPVWNSVTMTSLLNKATQFRSRALSKAVPKTNDSVDLFQKEYLII